ncbi:MAG: septum formation family protein [Nocardioidaceae bacterium]|nr:septum formation family protein [Nocardioidaceae bacterium]
MRRRLLATTCALLLAAVAGCGGDDTQPSTTPRTPATAPAPPAAPSARACYDLPFQAALEPTNDATPVPCTTRHTTQTLYVGQLDPLVDGHLLAVDSARLQNQVARTCRARTEDRLGGDEETRRLSRLAPVWFSPSLKQSEAGALWFRCDLVYVAGPNELAPLPARTHGLLASPKALDRFGTCATASPADRAFQRVACARKHSWRARASIDLPAKARYLDKAAGKDADARCRDIDAGLAADNLRLKWSFEWPTKEQWASGQRYGLCWTPDPA